MSELHRGSGDWAFVDIGFASSSKSSGLAFGDEQPVEVNFADLQSKLLERLSVQAGPLNLLIEAPLSVAFDSRGNPVGRSIEKRGSETRYWYTGLGCAVMVAASYLMRSILEAKPKCDIRLFEGFASFKPRKSKSSHVTDVRLLRRAVFKRSVPGSEIVAPTELCVERSHTLRSAFFVAGMDFGCPPVVVLSGSKRSTKKSNLRQDGPQIA